jgi:hypothetical protein
MIGDDFISKLVEETMSHTTEQDESVQCDVIELEKYFNRKNHVVPAVPSHSLHASSLEVQLEFISKLELGVYRLEWNDEIWDFPMNWSVFEMMDEGCSISIKNNHRHAHLLSAFSGILNNQVEGLDFSYVGGKLICSVKSVQVSQLAAA